MSGMHCVHSDTAADGKHFSTSKYQQGWPYLGSDTHIQLWHSNANKHVCGGGCTRWLTLFMDSITEFIGLS